MNEQPPIGAVAMTAGSLNPEPTTDTARFNTSSTSLNEADLARAKQIITTIANAYESRIVGQEGMRRSMVVALMCSGHILVESVPGLAKTTAVSTLAHASGGSFHRIQCTPDLLPSDIVGGQIFDIKTGQFITQLGPVHANFVLLDEINRSSAKTQSAMLEAMQERQTSIGGQIYPLPKPFIVMATQNPIEEEGTYVLPEAQMDRFLLKTVLAYPKPEEELTMLQMIESGVYDAKASFPPSVTLEDLLLLQEVSKKIYVDQSIKNYIVSIVNATRNPNGIIPDEQARYIQYGASPRASIAFLQVARAVALLSRRTYVIPEDVKALRYDILRHRIILNFDAAVDQVHPEAIIDAIFNAIKTP